MQQHTYPSKYPPGTHWATDTAWEILDTIPPDTLDSTQRAYIAGYIAGALLRVASKSNQEKADVI